MALRVLHVINQLSNRAGAEVSLRELALGSRGGPIDYGVAVLKPDGHVLQPFVLAGVPVYVPSRPIGRLGTVRHVVRTVRSFRPDLIHTSLFDADLAGRLAAWVTRTPTLTSLVNSGYGAAARDAESVAGWKLTIVNRVDRLLASTATSGFHAISHAAANHAVQHLGIPPQRIRVVPRGRSRTLLGEPGNERRSRVRKREGWGQDRIVLNVARQEPQKGHVHLLEAFARLSADVPSARLVLVGREGRATPSIERSIKHHGLEGRVLRLGSRTDVPDLLAAADVFAFSSLYEGLGGAVIEAAAMGLPIVCFDLPPLREMLGDEHVWLVPTGDEGELADTLTEALVDEERAREVGDRARSRFEACFERQMMVDGMLQMYQEAYDKLSAKPRSQRRRVPRLTAWS